MSLYVMPSSCSLFFIREARAAADKSVYLMAQLNALREDKRQVYVCNYLVAHTALYMEYILIWARHIISSLLNHYFDFNGSCLVTGMFGLMQFCHNLYNT